MPERHHDDYDHDHDRGDDLDSDSEREYTYRHMTESDRVPPNHPAPGPGSEFNLEDGCPACDSKWVTFNTEWFGRAIESYLSCPTEDCDWKGQYQVYIGTPTDEVFIHGRLREGGMVYTIRDDDGNEIPIRPDETDLFRSLLTELEAREPGRRF